MVPPFFSVRMKFSQVVFLDSWGHVLLEFSSAHLPFKKLVCIYTLTTPVLDTPISEFLTKILQNFTKFNNYASLLQDSIEFVGAYPVYALLPTGGALGVVSV